MGLRGPVSVKNRSESGSNDTLRPPSWLTKEQRVIFRQLVDEAAESGLGISHLDAHAFAVTAASMDEYIKKPTAQTRRDLIQLLRDLGGTPMSRARLGSRKDEKKPSKMAQLLNIRSA